jgi:cytochrome oxidase assembly protein ShyY1
VYAFVRRPRWIVFHVLVVVVTALFSLAGVWQLHRLSEKREGNKFITSQRGLPVVTLDSFVGDPQRAAQRRVRAVGRYDLAREVVLLGRPNGDAPGNHLLTPLVLEGGRAVIVDRGWVPEGSDHSPVEDALPPNGRVTVVGIVLPSEGRGPFGGASSAPAEQVERIDTRRLGRSLPYRTLPTYLVLEHQDPRQPGKLPEPVTLEKLSEGPHLLYAIQWFCFIPIGLIGYVFLLRREARRANPRAAATA